MLYDSVLYKYTTNIDIGDPYKIFKRHCSCTASSSFFSERVTDIWNSLPSNAVDFTSLASFKRSISSFDFSSTLCTLCLSTDHVLWICILFFIFIFIFLFLNLFIYLFIFYLFIFFKFIYLFSFLFRLAASAFKPCCPALLFNICSLYNIRAINDWLIDWLIGLIDIGTVTGWQSLAKRRPGPEPRTSCVCTAWTWCARCWPDRASCCRPVRCSCSRSRERPPGHHRPPTDEPLMSPAHARNAQFSSET